MMTAQKLYEAGYITYMRTDSKKYSPEFLAVASTYIKNEYGSDYENPNISSLKTGGSKQKGAQESTLPYWGPEARPRTL